MKKLEQISPVLLKKANSILDFTKPKVLQEIKDRLSVLVPVSTSTSTITINKYNYSKEAAVLIPLCTITTNSTVLEPSILFTVRNVKLRNHAGEVSFPGGLNDPALESPSDMQSTVRRETREELTSFTAPLDILGKLKSYPDKSRTIKVHPFVGYLGSLDISLDGVTWNEDEVSDVFTVPLSHLLNFENIKWSNLSTRNANTTDTTATTTSNINMRFPYWQGPERKLSAQLMEKDSEYHSMNAIYKDGVSYYKIWGLSAIILFDFLENILAPMLLQHKNNL